jgi:hypothetical protein
MVCARMPRPRRARGRGEVTCGSSRYAALVPQRLGSVPASAAGHHIRPLPWQPLVSAPMRGGVKFVTSRGGNFGYFDCLYRVQLDGRAQRRAERPARESSNDKAFNACRDRRRAREPSARPAFRWWAERRAPAPFHRPSGRHLLFRPQRQGRAAGSVGRLQVEGGPQTEAPRQAAPPHRPSEIITPRAYSLALLNTKIARQSDSRC